MTLVTFNLLRYPGTSGITQEGLPKGTVLDIHIPGQGSIEVGQSSWINESLRQGYTLDSLTASLPDATAHNLAPYWDYHGLDPVLSNCHTFSHIVGGLVSPDRQPSKNLITNRLLVDERDRQQIVSSMADVSAGDVLAVMGDGPTSPHSSIALGIGNLVVEVNGHGGEVAIRECSPEHPGYSGTHLVTLRHPTPALGTSHFRDGRLTPADDRPAWMISAEERATAWSQRVSPRDQLLRYFRTRRIH